MDAILWGPNSRPKVATHVTATATNRNAQPEPDPHRGRHNAWPRTPGRQPHPAGTLNTMAGFGRACSRHRDTALVDAAIGSQVLVLIKPSCSRHPSPSTTGSRVLCIRQQAGTSSSRRMGSEVAQARVFWSRIANRSSVFDASTLATLPAAVSSAMGRILTLGSPGRTRL